MCQNAPELPQFSPVVILLLNIVEDLIVRKDLLILVIIDGAEELEMVRMAMKLSVLLFNGLENVCAEPLTVLLWVKQESGAKRSEGWNVGS